MIKAESLADNLPELPVQPKSALWPTESWPVAENEPSDAARFNQLAEEVFDLSDDQSVTYALLVIKNGLLC